MGLDFKARSVTFHVIDPSKTGFGQIVDTLCQRLVKPKDDLPVCAKSMTFHVIGQPGKISVSIGQSAASRIGLLTGFRRV